MSANIPSFLRNRYVQGPMSLWNARGSYYDNGQEYFNLEIYSDENYVENNNEDFLNKNTYKCHICNLDVPKTYTEEHNASTKHETCMKIANIALERAQLHMKSNLIQQRLKIEVIETYFCDHCTAVVQIIDRDKHLLSIKHLSCVKNDGLLQKLVKIYEEPDKNSDVGDISVKDIELCKLIDALAISEVKVENNTKENAHTSTDDTKSKHKIDSDTDNVKENADQTTEDTKSKHKIDSDTDNVIENAEQTTEGPKSKHKIDSETDNVKVNEDKTTKDPKLIKIDSEDMTVNNNQQSIVKNHYKTNKLKKNKIKAKKIDKAKPNLIEINDVSENKAIDKSMEAAEEENNGSNQPNDIEITSEIEKESLAKEKPKYSEKLNELRFYLGKASFLFSQPFNVKAYSEDSVSISSLNTAKVNIPLKNFHGYDVTGEDVVCKICQCMSSVNGRKHKWNDVHMKKVMSPIKKGYFRQVSDTLEHCIVCNSLHSTSQIADHIASKEHVNNKQKYVLVKEITKKIAQLAIANNINWTDNMMYCKVCDIHIPKTNDSVNTHVQSADHVKTFDCLLKRNNIVKLPCENDSFICLACEKKIRSGHILSHCKFTRHRRLIATLYESQTK